MRQILLTKWMEKCLRRSDFAKITWMLRDQRTYVTRASWPQGWRADKFRLLISGRSEELGFKVDMKNIG